MASAGNAIVDIAVSMEQLVLPNQQYRVFTAVFMQADEVALRRDNYEEKIKNWPLSVQKQIEHYFAYGLELRVLPAASFYKKQETAVLSAALKGGAARIDFKRKAITLYVEDGVNDLAAEWQLAEGWRGEPLRCCKEQLPAGIVFQREDGLVCRYKLNLKTVQDFSKLERQERALQSQGSLEITAEGLKGNILLDNALSLAEQRQIALKLKESFPAWDGLCFINGALAEVAELVWPSYAVLINSATALDKWLVAGWQNRPEAFIKCEYNTLLLDKSAERQTVDDDQLEAYRAAALGGTFHYEFLDIAFLGNLVTANGAGLNLWFIRQSLINDVKAACSQDLLNAERRMRNSDFKALAMVFEKVLSRYAKRGLIESYQAVGFTLYEDLSPQQIKNRETGGFSTQIVIPQNIVKITGEIKEALF